MKAALLTCLFVFCTTHLTAKTIWLPPGRVELKEPIKIEANSNERVLLAGKGPGRTILTGAKTMANVNFTKGADGIWRTALDTKDSLDIIWLNGKRMDMARYPNKTKGGIIYETWRFRDGDGPDSDRDPLSAERIARWGDVSGAYLHALHGKTWGDLHYRIKGRKVDGSLDMEGGWQNNRPSQPHRRFRYVENIREELDAPGEWYYDRGKKELLVIPLDGEEPKTLHYASLPTLLQVSGEGVTVSNITFTGTLRTFMDNKERMFRSDWTICRRAAVEFSSAKNCRMIDCDFKDLGGNAIVFDGFNDHCLVQNGLFEDIGANGVVFAGRDTCVRDALYDYGDVPNYNKMDMVPGPASEDYPRKCVVRDCLFRRTGREEKQTAPVAIFASSQIGVVDCTICDVPRAGINIGTGAFGGHLIEGCDVFETVRETGDHGSFNSWGRDRYWQADLKAMENAVAKDPAVAFLDAVKPTILRRNRWRCDHGWDIDLDDGSSNYVIEDNLCLNGGIKLREGYNRVVRGNFVANNTLHPHCWLLASHDVVTNNVFFAPFKPAGRQIHWGDAVSPNTMVSAQAMPSIPEGDWGVKSQRLRALSSHPRIDKLRTSVQSKDGGTDCWRDMQVRKIDPSVEFSAFGVLPTTRGFVVMSDAKPPFRDGDLLLGESLPQEGKAAETVAIVRNQREMSVKLPGMKSLAVPPERLAARQAFSDMKLGIFIHWGIYALFAQHEQYLERSGIELSEYEKAANAFYPHGFDAREWVRAIKASGAKYIVFTARHHDGFSMWDTEQSDYNIVKATPFGRDVVKELAEACKEEGIRLGLYYSLMDWRRQDYPTGWRDKARRWSDRSKEDYASYLAFMKAQLTELLTKYGDVLCIWFDGEWDHYGERPLDWKFDEIYSLIHRLQPKCLVLNNHHHLPREGEDIQAFERDLPGENKGGYSAGQKVARNFPLESNDTMTWGAWGYQVGAKWKSIGKLREMLSGANERGANLLLNIGPRPDGKLPEQAVELMRQLGVTSRD